MNKNLPANAGDTGSIPRPGRIHVLQSNQAHMPQLLKPACLEPGLHIRRRHGPQHCGGGGSSPRPPQRHSGGESSPRPPSITVGVGPLRDPQHHSGDGSSLRPPASQWGGSSPRCPSIAVKRRPRSLQLEKAVQQPRPTTAPSPPPNLILIQHTEAFGWFCFVHEGYSKM